MSAPAVTPAAVQAALGTDNGSCKIMRADQVIDGTIGAYYVQGGEVYPGRTRWCVVNNTDTAANQAVAIKAALLA